jgi:hypothetical protein
MTITHNLTIRRNIVQNFINRKTPIVFVPGLFGSMSDNIIPGSGSWSFGMAGIVYDPFIRIEKRLLKRMHPL